MTREWAVITKEDAEVDCTVGVLSNTYAMYMNSVCRYTHTCAAKELALNSNLCVCVGHHKGRPAICTIWGRRWSELTDSGSGSGGWLCCSGWGIRRWCTCVYWAGVWVWVWAQTLHSLTPSHSLPIGQELFCLQARACRADTFTTRPFRPYSHLLLSLSPSHILSHFIHKIYNLLLLHHHHLGCWLASHCAK